MSDELIVDLTNYKDRVGNRVAPGRYTVIVEDVESDTSKAGNPMVNTWLRVQGGDFDGATIIDRLTVTEKALFRVVGFMQAVGLPTPKKKFKMNPRVFVGKTLDIDVEDGEPYNGRVKSEVRGYMRSTGKSPAADEGTDLDDLETDTETASAAPAEEKAAEPTAETGAADPAASPVENPPAAAETEATDEVTLDLDSDSVDLDSIDLS